MLLAKQDSFALFPGQQVDVLKGLDIICQVIILSHLRKVLRSKALVMQDDVKARGLYDPIYLRYGPFKVGLVLLGLLVRAHFLR